MQRKYLLLMSCLSLGVFSFLQAVLGRLVSPTVVPQSSSEQEVNTPAVEATDSDFSFSHIVVPDQGRPVGRIRGGGSR